MENEIGCPDCEEIFGKPCDNKDEEQSNYKDLLHKLGDSITYLIINTRTPSEIIHPIQDAYTVLEQLKPDIKSAKDVYE